MSSSPFISEVMDRIESVFNKRIDALTARVKELESERTFGVDEMERRRLWIDVATIALRMTEASAGTAIEYANRMLAAFDAQFAERKGTP